MENKNRHNYSTVYVCRVVFGWGSGRKKDTGHNGKKFPLSLQYPTFICECSFDLLKLTHTENIT